ncbi:hypothetical protein [Rhodococcus sp. AG1013]|uniref:hypothetical protein n=1 Tax=unclassified Rhodococcus (in: high G+C Gram-positive bacteria) TaxID=192944 RepID=UPI000E0A401F|nr:hypothetical protein [Rhodococcus sp. AG1013]RDI32668.1 hypothetical protein DEU38_103405 [Rhodococcus sp. AG1013]
MAIKFGVTAWGRVWLRTIESTTASSSNSLLPQARTLSGNGSVVLTVAEAGRIRADVTVRGKAFPVGIDVPLWDRRESATVRATVARAGADDRRVAAGELPDGLVAELVDKGISLTGDVADHAGTCACTGRRKPCLHHLAAIYQLVQRIDEEPALAVALRERRSATAARFAEGSSSDWIPLSRIDVARYYGV